MNLTSEGESEARFKAYVAGLASVVGHVDRAGPLRDYCTGLILPGERKSVEPMAAITAPSRTSAQHQSLLHFVGVAAWSDEKVLAKVRDMVLPAMERHGPVEAWIIDDTGFPKHGKHSVGVQVQYCGQLGAADRVAVNREAPPPVFGVWGSTMEPNSSYISQIWGESARRIAATALPASHPVAPSSSLARTAPISNPSAQAANTGANIIGTISPGRMPLASAGSTMPSMSAPRVSRASSLAILFGNVRSSANSDQAHTDRLRRALELGRYKRR